jgi:hypothetical protein
MVSLKFSIDLIFQATLWPGVDSASNRNVYQECLLVGKGGRCIRLANLLSSYADYHEISEPQPPANLRGCPGLYRDCFTFYLYLTNRSQICCLNQLARRVIVENGIIVPVKNHIARLLLNLMFYPEVTNIWEVLECKNAT